jgi:hypothetical protein
MKIITSYISGFKMSGKLLKMTFLIYSINLILGLIVVLPFLSDLKIGIGSSMLPDNLIKDFDYTSFSEFLRQSKGFVNSYIHQAKWMILLYFFVSIAFSGGILFIINKKEKFSVVSFLKGCAIYFFRFFKLFVYMLLFYFIIVLIVILPLVLIINGVTDTVDSESTLFYIGLYGAIIFLFCFGIIQMVAYYAKIKIVAEDSRKVFISIINSFGFVFKHFICTYSMFLLLIIVPIFVWVDYFFIRNLLGPTSGFTVFVLFFVQQVFILLRIFFRIWKFGSQYELYTKYNE